MGADVMKTLLIVMCVWLFSNIAFGQQSPDVFVQTPGPAGVGWQGFTDVSFMLNALLTLTLATVLGAAIAYHPKHGQTADTLEEIEAPKVFMLYSVIGAIIGIMVVKYGLVVGFVLFGIGGLIRFRTYLRSARLNGQVILVTLIGLSCGLDLPHIAVLATAFGFVLIYILDIRVTYRIDVRALPSEHIAAAAVAYRSVLEQQGCRILSEKKNPLKNRLTFVFQNSGTITGAHLEKIFDTKIDPSLKGAIDWKID